jgi:DNA-binding NtrC family response regulator
LPAWEHHEDENVFRGNKLHGFEQKKVATFFGMTLNIGMAKKILYVDDNQVMLDLIRTLLEGAGYEVLTANNPDQALALARGASFGVIILDVNLAGDSGLMLMNFMLNDHKGVPIVLYSGGEHTDPAVEKMLGMGAARFVAKRSGKEMVAAVKQLCPLS